MCGVDFRVESPGLYESTTASTQQNEPVDQRLKRDKIKLSVLWNRNCGWENSRPNVLAAGLKLEDSVASPAGAIRRGARRAHIQSSFNGVSQAKRYLSTPSRP